jgi:hypothetical protein
MMVRPLLYVVAAALSGWHAGGLFMVYPITSWIAWCGSVGVAGILLISAHVLSWRPYEARS